VVWSCHFQGTIPPRGCCIVGMGRGAFPDFLFVMTGPSRGARPVFLLSLPFLHPPSVERGKGSRSVLLLLVGAMAPCGF
jgi:hypothetical protein